VATGAGLSLLLLCDYFEPWQA